MKEVLRVCFRWKKVKISERDLFGLIPWQHVDLEIGKDIKLEYKTKEVDVDFTDDS